MCKFMLSKRTLVMSVVVSIRLEGHHPCHATHMQVNICNNVPACHKLFGEGSAGVNAVSCQRMSSLSVTLILSPVSQFVYSASKGEDELSRASTLCRLSRDQSLMVAGSECRMQKKSNFGCTGQVRGSCTGISCCHFKWNLSPWQE